MSETSIADRWRYWRHIQNLCGFSTPTAMGQSFIITLYFVFIAFAYFKINQKVGTSLFNSRSNICSRWVMDVNNKITHGANTANGNVGYNNSLLN
jgi:hypothetical protein